MGQRRIIIAMLLLHSVFLPAKESCDAFLDREGACSALSKKAEMTFSDGSKLANPLYQPQVALSAPKEGDSPVNDADERLLDAQVELAQALEAMPASKISPRFKAALLSQSTMSLADLFSETAPEYELMMPWPPDEPSATRKPIDFKRVQAFLKKNLSPGVHASIAAKVKQEPSPLGGQRLVLPKQLSAAEYHKRVERLFAETKESFIRRFLRGRSPAQLSPQETALYEKIKTVRLESPESSDIPMSCSGTDPNAFYIPAMHSISVCESFNGYPDAALVAALGHEIGHSIDPCRSQLPLLSVDESSLFSSNASEVESSDMDEITFAKKVLQMASHNGNYSMPDFALRMSQPEAVMQTMKDKYGVQQVASGVPAKEYPYAAVKQCFQDLGFRGTNSVETELEIQSTFRHLPKLERDRLRHDVMKKLNTFPECLEFKQPSEMNETMGDYFAALSVADHLEKNPPKSKDDKLAPVLFFLMENCRSHGLGSVDFTAVMSAPGSLRAEIDSLREKHQSHRVGEHGEPMLRAKKIIFSNPKLAQIIGCEPGAGRACMDDKLLSTSVRGSGGKSTTSPTSNGRIVK